jgi:hypothetical protein
VQDSTGDEQPLSGTSASPPPPSFQHDTEGVSEGIDEWVDVSEGSDGGVGDLFEEEEGHLHEAQERLSTALRQAQERSVLLSSSLADVGEAGRGRGQGRVMHGAAGRGDAATEAAAARKEAASAAAGAEVCAVSTIATGRFARHPVEVSLLIWALRCRCCRACQRSFYAPSAGTSCETPCCAPTDTVTIGAT